jgi:hypothetical protein
VNRNDLRALARSRLADGRALPQAGRFDGAYYLLGLGVECALKACICRKTLRYDFPDKDLAFKSYSHELPRLVQAADLEQTLETAMRADARLAANWLVVKDWSIESRYATPGQAKAEALEAAVNDRRHGVMRWIRQHW